MIKKILSQNKMSKFKWTVEYEFVMKLQSVLLQNKNKTVSFCELLNLNCYLYVTYATFDI